MLKYPAKWEDEGDCLSISFLDFKWIVTQGKTMEELIEMAEDALTETVSYMYEKEREIPEPSKVEGDNVVYIPLPHHIAMPVLIRKFRKEAGLTQKDMAERIKVPYTSYQRWEQADKFNPTLSTMEKITKALGKELILDIQ